MTRGDANPTVDSTPVAPHKVRGVAVLRVPWMGSPVVWVTDHDWVALIAAVLAVAMTLYLSTLDRRRRRPPSPPPTRPWLRRSRAAIAASAVIAAGAATSSTDATDAAFAASTRNTGDTLSAATSFSPYQDAVTADAPFLYWRLNETSGTLAGDSSGQAYTGTYYGTYSQSQPSALATEPYDSSVLFNAGHVSGRSATTGPATFTLEVWIKTTTTSGGAILGFGSGSGSTSGATVDRQLYMAPSGNVVLGLGATRSVIGSPTALNDGRWHHLAGTYSAVNGAILYVDGTRVATSPGAVPVPLTGRWRVAYQPLSNWPTPPTSDYFTGIVDEVAVYTTTLSPSRVQAHYTAATT